MVGFCYLLSNERLGQFRPVNLANCYGSWSFLKLVYHQWCCKYEVKLDQNSCCVNVSTMDLITIVPCISFMVLQI